jgi:hypothetical protein
MELQRDVGQVESHFGTFRCKIGARFAPNVPEAQTSFWTHPRVLRCDEARLKACFGPFRDSATLDARSVHGLRRTYHRLETHFGHARWNSNLMWVMWNLILVHLDAR